MPMETGALLVGTGATVLVAIELEESTTGALCAKALKISVQAKVAGTGITGIRKNIIFLT